MTESNMPRRRRGGAMRIPRTRGALSGFLLIVLGAWGALIPFIGPYFKYAYTPDTTWTWTTARLWLEVVPGVAAILGGLILLMTANRASALFGGWLASAAGAWFVVGQFVSKLWDGEWSRIGDPIGGPKRQVVEQLGFFSGLGVVILFLAAHAAGRVTVRSVKDLELVERHANAEPGVVDEHRRGRKRGGRDAGARDTVGRDAVGGDAGGRDAVGGDAGGRDAGGRDAVGGDETRHLGRGTGRDDETAGGRSGATPLGETERRSGGTGEASPRERR